MCTAALSCVCQQGCVAPLSLLGRSISGLPSPMILKLSGAFAHEGTLCCDALPGSFRVMTSVFCGIVTGSSAVKDELNFTRELLIWSLLLRMKNAAYTLQIYSS